MILRLFFKKANKNSGPKGPLLSDPKVSLVSNWNPESQFAPMGIKSLKQRLERFVFDAMFRHRRPVALRFLRSGLLVVFTHDFPQCAYTSIIHPHKLLVKSRGGD